MAGYRFSRQRRFFISTIVHYSASLEAKQPSPHCNLVLCMHISFEMVEEARRIMAALSSCGCYYASIMYLEEAAMRVRIEVDCFFEPL